MPKEALPNRKGVKLCVGEATMPRHEFFCKACEQHFHKTLTEEEFGEGGTVCPECGSEDVEQRDTAFYPINWKETA